MGGFGENAHLELALNFTTSFTCSMVDGFAASLPPPIEDMAMTVVPMSVPSARYSFLIARPKMTLNVRRPGAFVWVRSAESRRHSQMNIVEDSSNGWSAKKTQERENEHALRHCGGG